MSNASLELGGDNWAAKDGNLLGYAVGDSSGKYVPREFTFTRGSNLAATRVAANGLIEKGRENLAKNTNWEGASLDTAPTDYTGYLLSNGTFNTTSTEGQIRFTTDSSSRAIAITSTISETGIFTQSVYVDEVYTSLAVIDVINRSSSATAIGYYEDGVEITAYTNVQAGKRYSILWNKTGAASFRFGSGVNDAKAGDIVLSRPQIEVGLVATELIVSPVGSTGLAGLLENEPRIDYTGGTGSLLLEPSRTNVLRYSEYLDGWNQLSNITATPNDAVSPEGVQNAYKIEATSSGFSYFRGAEFTSTGSNVFSIFAKKGNAQYIFLASRFFNGFTDTYVWFDVENGTKGGINGESFNYGIEDYGNGWYRCYLIHDVDASDLFGYCYVGLADTDLSIDSASGLNAYYYGGQWEEGSYPTSYIPNHSGGSVTRDADDLNDLDVSSMLTSSSFTWFLDLNDYIGSDINSQNIWLESTSSSIEIQFRVRPDGYRVYYSGIAGGSTYPIVGSTTANKFCVSYDGNDYRLYVDGTLERTITSVGDSGWDIIRNQMSDASLPLKQMLLFPTALSDAQCSALTVEGLKEEILTSYIAAVDTLEDGAEARLDTYLQNLEELIV